MSKHEHQNEANFSFMQSMVQSESAAPIPGQLNFMQETSQNQFSLVPMRPPNDGNQVASYLLNLDKGSSSQSQMLDFFFLKAQMLNFDPNLMQLIAKNEGVVDITNQVDVPLDCANQINALGKLSNQHDMPVDLTNHLFDE